LEGGEKGGEVLRNTLTPQRRGGDEKKAAWGLSNSIRVSADTEVSRVIGRGKKKGRGKRGKGTV